MITNYIRGLNARRNINTWTIAPDSLSQGTPVNMGCSEYNHGGITGDRRLTTRRPNIDSGFLAEVKTGQSWTRSD